MAVLENNVRYTQRRILKIQFSSTYEILISYIL